MEAFRTEMINGVADTLGDLTEYQLTAEAWEAILRLAEEKYRSWEWTFDRSPQFTVNHKFRLESGNFEAHLIVKNGIIKDIELANQSAESSSVRNVINQFTGERYDLKCTGG